MDVSKNHEFQYHSFESLSNDFISARVLGMPCRRNSNLDHFKSCAIAVLGAAESIKCLSMCVCGNCALMDDEICICCKLGDTVPVLEFWVFNSMVVVDYAKDFNYSREALMSLFCFGIEAAFHVGLGRRLDGFVCGNPIPLASNFFHVKLLTL